MKISATFCIVLILAATQLRAEPGHVFPPLKPEDILKIQTALPDTAAKPAKPRKLLLFYRTEGFVHGSIPFCNEAIKDMGDKTGAYSTDLSDDMKVMTADNLKQYDAILFNSTTGLKFEDPAARQALLDFAKSGKGIIGIHAATDNFNTWPEGQELLGGHFHGHPWHSNSVEAVKLDDPKSPMNASFGGGFWINDEIYQMTDPFDRAKVRVLLSLDMSKPQNERPHDPKNIVRTDNDFPISWIKTIDGGGRVFYCSLGHNPSIFWCKPVLQHYLEGIQFALGDLQFDTVPSAKIEPALIPSPAPDVVNILNPPPPGQKLSTPPPMTSPTPSTTPTVSPSPAPTQPPAASAPSPTAQPVASVSATPSPSTPSRFDVSPLKSYNYGLDRSKVAALIEQIRTQGDGKHEEIEASLIPLLADSSVPTGGKDFTCRLLGQIGSDKSVPNLAALLPDKTLSHMAAYALFQIGTPSAKEALTKSLAIIPDDLKPAILGALARLKDSDALPELAKLADSDSESVSNAAIQALSFLGTSEALEKLALVKVSPTRENDFYWACIEAAKRVHASNPDLTMQPVEKLLTRVIAANGNRSTQVAAISVLGSVEPDAALAALSEMLKSSDVRNGVVAATLVPSYSPPTSDKLVQLFPSLDPIVQTAIINRISISQSLTKEAFLKAGLASKDASVHLAAITGLGTADLPDSAALLEPLLAGSGDDSAAAVAALSQLKKSDPFANDGIDFTKSSGNEKLAVINLIALREDSKMKADIFAAAQDPNPEIANAAYRAIAVLSSPDDLDTLLALIPKTKNDDQRKSLNRAVSRAANLAPDKAKAESEIVDALKISPITNRQPLVLALTSIGSDKATQTLSDLLKDPSIDNRKDMIRTLSQARNPVADQLLLTAAKGGTENSEKILAVRGFLDSVQDEKLSPDTKLKDLKEAWGLTVRQDERDAILSSLKLMRGAPAKKLYTDLSAEQAPAATPSPSPAPVTQLNPTTSAATHE